MKRRREGREREEKADLDLNVRNVRGIQVDRKDVDQIRVHGDLLSLTVDLRPVLPHKLIPKLRQGSRSSFPSLSSSTEPLEEASVDLLRATVARLSVLEVVGEVVLLLLSSRDGGSVESVRSFSGESEDRGREEEES